MSDREKAENYGDGFVREGMECCIDCGDKALAKEPHIVQAYLAGAESKDREWQAKMHGLVDALQFYANRNNWKWSCGDEISDHYDQIYRDSCNGNGSKKYHGGLKAREALAQFNSGQPAQGVVVPRDLFRELVDNCQASIAEVGVSHERIKYRNDLYERAKGHLARMVREDLSKNETLK